MHAEIDGDIEHARALGKIHAEEKDVAPRAVREIHAHRRALAQDRVRAVRSRGAAARARKRSGWSFGCPMRNIHWLPRTVRTLRRTWSASVWKAEPVIRGGERAAQRGARAFGFLRGEKDVDRLFKAPREELLVAVKRDVSARRQLGCSRADESGGSRRERRARGPARRDFRCCWRNCSSACVSASRSANDADWQMVFQRPSRGASDRPK